jgi:hypothetical protein
MNFVFKLRPLAFVSIVLILQRRRVIPELVKTGGGIKKRIFSLFAYMHYAHYAYFCVHHVFVK